MKSNNQTVQKSSAPPGWTASQAVDCFTQFFGESDDYLAKAKAQIQEANTCLKVALDRALTYFGADPKSLAGASDWAKLSRLETLLEGKESRTEEYDRRFREDLRHCRFGLAEQERIMLNVDQHTRLAPMLYLARHIFEAALNLEESMVCEHTDYTEKMGYAEWP
jgi:hypothetical protein